MTLPERWVRVDLEVAAEAEEAAAEGLRSLGAGGTEHGAPQDGKVTVSAHFPQEDAARVGAGLEELLGRLASSGLQSWAPRLRQEEVDGADWAEGWKRFFHPLRIGAIWIRPSWEAADPPPGTRPIVLDPGLAFGTGTHPTTRLCLEALQRHLHPGDLVIDVGTGSGILAMAAALLGARRVVACDIDPVAVRVARANVEQNRLQWAVEVLEGSVGAADTLLRRERSAGARLVVANLLTSILAELAGPIAGLMAPRGLLLASGIAAGQEGEAHAALEGAGLRVQETETAGGWCLLAAER
ncbi:50S ribosomal protein L11 methyltransferase [Limnochorda pilosa]|uniref:Ribosomal protein L11 methyltransferase n=1 Tax=Limnochorda pilosa TaxID=1555112 RepID=A0A0K2SNS9_LIMPI|nr:50S ribosomal protein L11 methyltransferase [Limnochorda pilosa]BAS28489.1 50S ribosomal protein L11 methyltransferase [Limnochorda pilosa]